MDKTDHERYKNQGEKVEKELKDIFGEKRVEPGTNKTATLHVSGGANTSLSQLAKNGFIVEEIHDSIRDGYSYRLFISEAKPEITEKETTCHCCGQTTTKQVPSLESRKELK